MTIFYFGRKGIEQTGFSGFRSRFIPTFAPLIPERLRRPYNPAQALSSVRTAATHRNAWSAILRIASGDCAGVARKLLYKHALACCKSGAGVIVRMQPPLRTRTLGAQFCGRMNIFMLCSLCIVSCVCFLAVL